MSTEKIFNMQDLGAGEIQQRLKDGGDLVIVPVGSCERHGNPFTPTGLECRIMLEITERTAKKANVLHTPVMPFGYTPEHMGPLGGGSGTIQLRAETYKRILEDISRSLIYHGFNKVVFISFHDHNLFTSEEVLLSLRHKTNALVMFYGGRKMGAIEDILKAEPGRLSSDIEAAMAMAIMGEKFNAEGYLSHRYQIHAPKWLGSEFYKKPASGMFVQFDGESNIMLGMEDSEYVEPIALDKPLPSEATAEKGHKIIDHVVDHFATFIEEVKKIDVQVKTRDFPDRVR